MVIPDGALRARIKSNKTQKNRYFCSSLFLHVHLMFILFKIEEVLFSKWAPRQKGKDIHTHKIYRDEKYGSIFHFSMQRIKYISPKCVIHVESMGIIKMALGSDGKEGGKMMQSYWHHPPICTQFIHSRNFEIGSTTAM